MVSPGWRSQICLPRANIHSPFRTFELAEIRAIRVKPVCSPGFPIPVFRLQITRRRGGSLLISFSRAAKSAGRPEAQRKGNYGTGNHGSRKGAAVCRRTATVQHRPGEPAGFAASPVLGAGGHLAGPGTREVCRRIQAGDEGAEEVRRAVQGAHALFVEKSPAHRRISEPTLTADTKRCQ